jgi:hypothetical protein
VVRLKRISDQESWLAGILRWPTPKNFCRDIGQLIKATEYRPYCHFPFGSSPSLNSFLVFTFAEAHKAYELGGYTTAAKEFWPLRSDLERAVDRCTRSVHRDDPDFDAYNEASSVILFDAIPESRSKFHKCMSQKGYR